MASSDEENMLGDGIEEVERIEWPGIRSICLILLEMPDMREEKGRREEERRGRGWGKSKRKGRKEKESNHLAWARLWERMRASGRGNPH